MLQKSQVFLVSLLFFLLGWVHHASAQLVSREEVDAAKTKAILWTIFAAIMVGVTIFQFVRLLRKKK
jgi:hypothetical protein